MFKAQEPLCDQFICSTIKKYPCISGLQFISLLKSTGKFLSLSSNLPRYYSKDEIRNKVTSLYAAGMFLRGDHVIFEGLSFLPFRLMQNIRLENSKLGLSKWNVQINLL